MAYKRKTKDYEIVFKEDSISLDFTDRARKVPIVKVEKETEIPVKIVN